MSLLKIIRPPPNQGPYMDLAWVGAESFLTAKNYSAPTQPRSIYGPCLGGGRIFFNALKDGRFDETSNMENAVMQQPSHI